MNFEVRYFVDTEKKVVVCKLENCSNALICDMCHKGWPGDADFLIKDSFIGKAKCSSEDVFDENIGKKIAYKRAIAKVFEAKRKVLKAFVTDYKRVTDELVKDTSKLIAKYENIVNRKDQDIEKILEEAK